MGNLSVNPLTPSTLQVTNYFPGTTYSVCGYFQTASKNLTAIVDCKRITTPDSTDEVDEIYTVVAKFSSTPSYADRQAILCHLETNMSDSSSEFITNTYGERCNSFYSGALFVYNGTVIDNKRDIYYMVTNDTSDATNESKIVFKAMFNDTTAELTTLNALNVKLITTLTSFKLDKRATQTEYTDLLT